MRLIPTISWYAVAVTADPNSPEKPPTETPDPEIGARWGKPAAYDFSAQTRTGVGIEPPWVELVEGDEVLKRTQYIGTDCDISMFEHGWQIRIGN